MPARMIAIFAGCAIACAAASPAAAELKVVVTMKPLHSLVAQIMAGAGTPELLVKGTASPHMYSLKPSDASRLNQADVFFRMSEAMEPFTAKISKSLPKSVQVVTLQSTRSLKLYPRRTGATFEDGHGDKDDHGHGHGHSHGHETMDGHAWLDPVNAKVLADRISAILVKADPPQANLYKSNAVALKKKLDELSASLKRELSPVAGKPYIVFHDALQYFERRYGLHAVGSIAMSPEVPPSAKRLSTLRKKITSQGALCIFAEPQFDTRLIANMVEGTNVRTGTIDPEGSKIEAGPELYFTLLRNLANDLKGCLAAQA